MQIRKIISNGQTSYKQDEISKAISSFYKKLYSKQKDLKNFDPNNDLFQDLPKISDVEKSELEKPINLEELEKTLKTCGESAPGPDGISYNVYKNTWPVSGPIILDAWNHSVRVGRTSTSQRESVITLLEKNGKDKSNIVNLRPISLSNCDIKICTKAIALRTNLVLDKLLNNTQTGYVPGRQVTNNNRMIEEIINMVKNEGEEAYLITLDAQKAFDSVDHEYLTKLLKVYNFPDIYIGWVKTIYTGLEASVLVNGYTTVKFNIEQSVKQGDALSCALFVLAIEPLLNRIQRNTRITPITITSTNPETGEVKNVEIKKSGFADDITCFTKDKLSLQEIIYEYERFSSYSGVHLNVSKTEVLVIGKTSQDTIRFDFKHRGNTVTIVDSDEVKICGITYSNNVEIAYDSNINDKIDKLKNQLQLWRQRNLSLEGKILIVKTFGLSQIIYALQSTYIKENDLKRIDSIITKFVWNLKESNQRPAGKIRKTIFNSTIANGGLNAPDIFAIDKAIKYKSLLQVRFSNHPLCEIYNKITNEMGFDFSNYTCRQVENSFLGKAVSAHIQNATKIHADIRSFAGVTDGIHKNYYSYIQNKSIVTNEFVNIRQNSMLTRLITHNISNLQGLHVQKTTNSIRHLFLDVHQIYNSFPAEWRGLLNNTRRQHAKIKGEVYITTNKWVNIKNISLRCLIDSFKHIETIDVNEYLKVKHESIRTEELTNNPFVVARKTIKDVKLRNLNYKMHHNIYPTMQHLFKWKIKDSEDCSLCKCKETLKHATYDCPVAMNAVITLTEVIKTRYGLQSEVNLSYENILFGLSSTATNVGLRVKQKIAIDHVIILLKQRLILQRENKLPIDANEIVGIFEERKNMDKYIKVKNRSFVEQNIWGT